MSFIKRLLNHSAYPQGMVGKIFLWMLNLANQGSMRWSLRHLNIQDDIHVLDIGCGGGKSTQLLSRKIPNGKIIAIDYSPLSVEYARRVNRIAIEKGQVEVREGDAAQLDFAPQSFELITAFANIHFWPDLPEQLQSIYSLLKPGGSFLITTFTDVEKGKKWEKYIDKMTIRSSQELVKHLTDAGFGPVGIYRKGKSYVCMITRR